MQRHWRRRRGSLQSAEGATGAVLGAERGQEGEGDAPKYEQGEGVAMSALRVASAGVKKVRCGLDVGCVWFTFTPEVEGEIIY